jgi:hypothetical protein
MQPAPSDPAIAPRTMHGLLASVRYTVRLLLKSPGFTVTAVLILGFGIGTNTAIFSLIDTVMLRPLPYPEPQQLEWLFMPTSGSSTTPFDYPDYCDFAAAQHTYSLSIEVSVKNFLLSAPPGFRLCPGRP